MFRVVLLVGKRHLARESDVLAVIRMADQPECAHASQARLDFDNQHLCALAAGSDRGTGAGGPTTDHEDIDVFQDENRRGSRRHVGLDLAHCSQDRRNNYCRPVTGASCPGAAAGSPSHDTYFSDRS